MNARASLKNSALGLLARRDHSILELSQKLTRYTEDKLLIVEVIQELKDLGFLDDARFADMFISARISRGKGPIKIQQDLLLKGLDSELIEKKLENYSAEWLAMAENVRRKKFGSTKPADFISRAKQMRFLQYRGFLVEHINQLFRGELT